MFTDQQPVSVRQLKRRATAHAITEQMLRLVIERGFEAVTIDEVAEAAEVSRRTFFNYFPSKEDALFGNPMADLSPQLLQRFLAKGPTGDLITDVLALVNDQSLLHTIDVDSVRALHELMVEDPRLLIAFKQRMKARHHELAELIGRREDLPADDARVRLACSLIDLIMGSTMERTATTPGLTGEHLSLELDRTIALLKGLLNPSQKD